MSQDSFLGLALVAIVSLTAASCGSGFVDGWRENSVVTDQERCERRQGWLWQGESCARFEDADLSLVGEEQICDQISDAKWIDSQCLRHASLTASQCETFGDMTWYDAQCMTLAEYSCRVDDRLFEDGECSGQQ